MFNQVLRFLSEAPASAKFIVDLSEVVKTKDCKIFIAEHGDEQSMDRAGIVFNSRGLRTGSSRSAGCWRSGGGSRR